jgi:hypothetical protein
MARKINIGGAKFSPRVSAKTQRKAMTVTVDDQDFAGVIARWPGLTEDAVEAILNQTTALAFESVKERTAVLTGEAQSQWFMTMGGRWSRFIGNNWPGIRRLEHGWSKRPGRGYMVRVTAKKVNGWVRELAAKYWNTL